MNKEYMSSEEIMRELEELKLRLAFQLEFEEEVKEVLAESEANPLPQHIADELGARVRRDMANFSKTDRHRRRAHGRTRPVAKVIKVIALVAVLITVSAGSAMAGFHMGRKVDVLETKATVYDERTSVRLVESGEYAVYRRVGRAISILHLYRRDLKLHMLEKELLDMMATMTKY